MKSIVLGTSAVDTLIHVPDIHTLEDDMSLWAHSVTETIGSTGAGKAFALDVLGADVTLFTDLGQDEYRTKIIDFFDQTNVRLVVLETDKSTAHTNIMHSRGKRITVCTSTPTVSPPVPNNFAEYLVDTDVVFLNINEYCRNYIPFLQNSDIPIVVHIHDYDEVNPYHVDFIAAANILIASDIYIKDHRKFLEQQINQGKSIVIVTKGREGLVAMDQNKNFYSLPGYNDFEFVDSNGAGDSFCAGFMYEFWRTKDLLEALRFGTVCGAMACASMDLYHRDYDDKAIRKIVKRVS